MKFASKSLVAVIITLSSLASQGKPALSAEPSATPHEISAVGQLDAYSHHYYVYYRCQTHGWRLKGCYDCPIDANEVADSLRDRGYEVKITCGY